MPGGDEGPQHTVEIASPFAVSKFDVTFAEWDACVAVGGCLQASEGGMGGGTKPVVDITWDEAQQYVKWLSTMTGKPYRLLSEAEWEYAARAGTITVYFWGDDVGEGNANCNGCGGGWGDRGTSPVGSFKANAFGLYDMAGNVWQLVQDCRHEDYGESPTDGLAWISGGDCSQRMLRGGSWFVDPRAVRSARRHWVPTDLQYGDIGFRVARTILAP